MNLMNVLRMYGLNRKNIKIACVNRYCMSNRMGQRYQHVCSTLPSVMIAGNASELS